MDTVPDSYQYGGNFERVFNLLDQDSQPRRYSAAEDSGLEPKVRTDRNIMQDYVPLCSMHISELPEKCPIEEVGHKAIRKGMIGSFSQARSSRAHEVRLWRTSQTASKTVF